MQTRHARGRPTRVSVALGAVLSVPVALRTPTARSAARGASASASRVAKFLAMPAAEPSARFAGARSRETRRRGCWRCDRQVLRATLRLKPPSRDAPRLRSPHSDLWARRAAIGRTRWMAVLLRRMSLLGVPGGERPPRGPQSASAEPCVATTEADLSVRRAARRTVRGGWQGRS